jgi:hypothetical protein
MTHICVSSRANGVTRLFEEPIVALTTFGLGGILSWANRAITRRLSRESKRHFPLVLDHLTTTIPHLRVCLINLLKRIEEKLDILL